MNLMDNYLTLHGSTKDAREFSNDVLGTRYSSSRFGEFMRGNRQIPEPLYRLMLAMVLDEKLRFFGLPCGAIRHVVEAIDYKDARP